MSRLLALSIIILALAPNLMAQAAVPQLLPGEWLELRLDRLDRELGALQVLHDACGNPLERIEIQKQVRELKRQAELDWLGYQLERARRQGRARSARFLEEAIENYLAEPETDTTPRPAEEGGRS